MPDGYTDLKKKITISDAAVHRLKELQSEEAHAGMMLRIAVGGGGCSGFQYSFTFDNHINDDDQTIEKDGVIVIIDREPECSIHLRLRHLFRALIHRTRLSIGSFVDAVECAAQMLHYDS